LEKIVGSSLVDPQTIACDDHYMSRVHCKSFTIIAI